ncbi:MAG: hypothetical protein ACYDAG_17250 [Chloroflexota bacterium]
MPEPPPASLLGVDCGGAFTRAALFEPVDGHLRLIARGAARTTAGSHLFDGLARACRQIEALTGRELFARGEPVAGEVSGCRGVEAMAVSLTCQRPLIVLATNSRIADLARAELCIAQMLDGPTLEGRLEQARSVPWDALIGPEHEVPEVKRLLSDEASAVVDGPARAKAQRSGGLSGLTVLAGEDGEIIRGLRDLSLRVARREVPGAAELAAAATQPPTTGPAALADLARLVAQRFSLRLALVDAGASCARLLLAQPDGTLVAWTAAPATCSPALGIRLPTTSEGLRSQHRDVAALLRSLTPRPIAADVVIGTGGILANAPLPHQPALTLLDGLRPSGVTQLVVDSACIASQVASFAGGYPELAAPLIERDGVIGLGTAVCLAGTAAAGGVALEVRWHSQADGGSADSRKVAVGELVRLPLPAGDGVTVELFPARAVDAGLGPGVAVRTEVRGGRLGLMVDARLGRATAIDVNEQWERWQ